MARFGHDSIRRKFEILDRGIGGNAGCLLGWSDFGFFCKVEMGDEKESFEVRAINNGPCVGSFKQKTNRTIEAKYTCEKTRGAIFCERRTRGAAEGF